MNKSSNPVTVVVVLAAALGGLALFATSKGWGPLPDKDKKFTDAAQPFTFTYPGSWDRVDPSEIPPNRLTNVAAIRRSRSAVIVIGSAGSVPAAQLEAAYQQRFQREGAAIQSIERPTVAGWPAVRFQLDYPPGFQDRMTTAVFAGQTVVGIDCQWLDDPQEARSACQKVLDTFQIRPAGS